MKKINNNRYDDIINLPHHVSSKRKAMSLGERSAQFAPFAALTGHDDAVKETARLTDVKHELSEEQIDVLSFKLNILKNLLPNCPIVEITYFKEDEKKAGGEYVTIKAIIFKIIENEQVIILEDKSKISIKDIEEIRGDCFGFDFEPK